MSLGEILKSEREKKGIRLADIASVTKIPAANLKLMEEGNWKALPPNPFIKGFLTAYSKYVGLNSTEIYHKYLLEIKPQEVMEVAPVPVPEPKQTQIKKEIEEQEASEVIANPKVLRMKPAALSVAGLALFMLTIWLIQIGKDSSSSIEEPGREVASAPSETETIPVPITETEPMEAAPAVTQSTVETQAQAPAPLPIPAPEQKEHQLEVQVKERSWAKIVIDDAPPVEFYLKAEEKTSFSAKEKIKLVLGNSTGAEVIHNGKDTAGNIYQGTIRYYIFPVGSKFPQDKTNRRVASEPQFADQPTNTEAEETSEE
jgi:cytoskeletal protein RodZ